MKIKIKIYEVVSMAVEEVESDHEDTALDEIVKLLEGKEVHSSIGHLEFQKPDCDFIIVNQIGGIRKMKED